MKSEDRIQLGEEAKRLLKHPLIEKFYVIETGRMFERFAAGLSDEEAGRLSRDAAALRRFKQRLEQFIKSGEIEERKQNGETSIADGIGPVI